jgi:hypothetical protein
MHNATIRIEFDPLNRRQVDEAKAQWIEAKQAGRQITDFAGKPLESFRQVLDGFLVVETPVSVDQIAVRIFDDSGDRRLIWNWNDPDQIAEAKALFEEYLAKGWKPYAVDRGGKIAKRITRFDWRLEEIVFDETGPRQRLKDFSRAFKEVKLLPRTYPG